MSQQFRKDIFVKGARVISPLERLERYSNQSFILVANPADVPMKLAGPIGEVTLQEDIYKPLVEILADNNHAPKSVKQIMEHPLWKQRALPNLVQSLVVLSGAGHVYPAQEPEAATVAQSKTRKLNAYLCKRARDGGEIAFLASPVIDGGIQVNRFQQLFLLSRHAAKNRPAEWATAAWDIISRQGQRLVKDGKTIESAAENLDELTTHAELFFEKQFPILKALGIE